MSFLPVTMEEVKKSGSDSSLQLDFILVSGDAYVDHPSFGVAIISRLLESYGYSVGIIPQPNWRNAESFSVLGTPKYAFLVTAGNIDSMVNHYSVAKKRRKKDYYSPNGEMGLRPDRASIVYSNKIREKFKNIPIILGGIEASLRRFSHYDYWDDKIRRSILHDSTADMLVYGMGEHQIVEIADALKSGLPISEITFIRGTSYRTTDISRVTDYIELPSFRDVITDKKKYSDSFLMQSQNTDSVNAKTLIEFYNEGYIVQNPPSEPLVTGEFDNVYALNYMRDFHPMYKDKGGIPAIEEVKFSVISNRGCFGNCNFCALAFHQGRVLQTRSHESILDEAEKIVNEKDFKGYIHDVGGPTANFRHTACDKQKTHGVCQNKQCLFPSPCKNMKISHEDYISLLKKIRKIPKVKKVFVRSGIRFDYLMADKNSKKFMNELCEHHVSGQLKVAPEHVAPEVLEVMGKPNIEVFEKFYKSYYDTNKKLDKKQYLVPYLMSSHPGSTIESAIKLAEFLRDKNIYPEQVQDFYPTPGTISTCIYYTEFDPHTKQKIYVEKNPHKKAIQRALMQYKLPQNYNLVTEGLKNGHREDLIGFDKRCLVRPLRNKNFKDNKNNSKDNKKSNDSKNFKDKRNTSQKESRTNQKSKPKKGKIRSNRKR